MTMYKNDNTQATYRREHFPPNLRVVFKTGQIIRTFSVVLFGVITLSACTSQLMQVPVVSHQNLITVDKPIRDQATFALSKVVANIKRGTVIAHYAVGGIDGVQGGCSPAASGRTALTWGTGTSALGNWSTELGEVFYETLSSAGLNIAGDPTDLFSQAETVGSAEYLIGARITSIASNICAGWNFWLGLPTYNFGGEMHMEVEWTVFSNLIQQETLTITTEGYDLAQPSRDGELIMFHNAFAHATEGLLTSSDFIAIAERNYAGAEAINFSGDEMAISSLAEARTDIESNHEIVLASIATVRVGQGHGSGFFISEDGLLLTNAHVVGEAQNVSILLNNGLEVPGKVLRKSDGRDIALIKVNLRVPNALPIRGQEAQQLERIYVVGTPEDESLSSTVTSGIISGIRTGPAGKLIQADAAISPGNSGGPLLDANGNVLGLSVFKIISRGSEGLNFFIPIHEALDALKIRMADPAL